MVVKDTSGIEIKMESQSLKFGMDRILSEEISSGRSEDPCTAIPPCAGCLSSLYRCCRTSTPLATANFYRNGIHAPQPLRPYTNVLISTEADANLTGQQSNPTNRSPTKRKRSWSRAVFSNLQRKGLEKRFQLQKYITKPDRRQLAATLGLTDAQVKVWFQNRRMKWRHAKESAKEISSSKETAENLLIDADSTQSRNTDSECCSDVDVQTVDD